MPRFDAQGVQFVSLLGGLTRNYAANPHDVMHRLAGKTGASAFVMPVPFFANTVTDREVLLAQRGVREVFELAARSSLKLVGIGEMLGHFFDGEGRVIETALTARTLSIDLDVSPDTEFVAVAGGDEKTGAIRSVLMSGRLNGLITDERTANALVNHP